MHSGFFNKIICTVLLERISETNIQLDRIHCNCYSIEVFLEYIVQSPC